MTNIKSETAHNYTFDAIKAVSCLFIILIHCKFPGKLGDLCEALARFGVPMFFAIAGYYLVKTGEDSVPEIRANMVRKLKKTLVITLSVWLAYTVYSFIYAMTVNYGVKAWFTEKFNLFEFSRLILFNSGKFIYDFTYAFDHLWYLFALVYVYGLVFIFAPLLKKGAKPISIILFAFLFFGNFLKLYYPIRPFGINISVWYVMRNWLFVGVPYTLLGYWIKEDKAALLIQKPPTMGMLLLITGLFSTFAEYRHFGTLEIYFGSHLIVIGLLLFGNAADINPNYLRRFFKADSDLKQDVMINKILSCLSFTGDKLSSNIYYFHVMLISLFGWFVDRINPGAYGSVLFMTIRPLIIITITILISFLFYKVKLITFKNGDNLRK